MGFWETFYVLESLDVSVRLWNLDKSSLSSNSALIHSRKMSSLHSLSSQMSTLITSLSVVSFLKMPLSSRRPHPPTPGHRSFVNFYTCLTTTSHTFNPHHPLATRKGGATLWVDDIDGALTWPSASHFARFPAGAILSLSFSQSKYPDKSIRYHGRQSFGKSHYIIKLH